MDLMIYSETTGVMGASISMRCIFFAGETDGAAGFVF